MGRTIACLDRVEQDVLPLGDAAPCGGTREKSSVFVLILTTRHELCFFTRGSDSGFFSRNVRLACPVLGPVRGLSPTGTEQL